MEATTSGTAPKASLAVPTSPSARPNGGFSGVALSSHEVQTPTHSPGRAWYPR